jgi:hypothetical protein
MKCLLLFLAMLGAVSLSSSPSPSSTTAAGSADREQAVYEFRSPVKLFGVLLQGEYLFIHDDRMMAHGDACTYVYKLEAGKPDKLVVSFHCIPAQREKVDRFTVRTVLVSKELRLYEVREIQFAGSSEAHRVPSAADVRTEIVDLVPCCL